MNEIKEEKNYENKYQYYYHGSEDSLDTDIVYVLPNLFPTKKENIDFCSGIKDENRNIIVINEELGNFHTINEKEL
jgi:hypothetical protein